MKQLIWMCLLLTSALPAQARETSREFGVGAVVPPRASVAPIGLPSQLELTDADLKRGYKELTATWRVRANDRRGYLLTLKSRTGLAEHVEVGGLGRNVVLRQDAVTIHRPRIGPSEIVVLNFRFVLTVGAEAGTYPLPVEVDVSPLGVLDLDRVSAGTADAASSF
jgi:hypothetical protein